MIDDADVVGHYHKAGLYSLILAGLGQAGLTQPTPRDLSAVDEFHIGGVEATRFVSEALPPPAAGRLLDIGCGIGGPARFIAAETGCDVTGIDLTKSFVETGNHLSRLVGLDGQVTLQTGNALALPFAENEFDAAYMIHVGMNISEKTQLISEAARVIMPGGRFIIYDVMQMQDRALTYPLPWAENETANAVSSPAIYLDAMEKAELVFTPLQNKHDFALQFFDRMAKKGAEKQPPALGLHLVMGVTTPQKIQNIHHQIKQGVLAPIVITASHKLVS